MSFKRKPAGSLDTMSSGGGMISSTQIDAFGGMLVQVGEIMQTVAGAGSSGGSSDA